MAVGRGWVVTLLLAGAVGTASSASAQVLGTFRWQFAPYCNTVTLTIQQVAGQFVANGFDDMCGATRSAPASGSAHLNSDGTVSLGITVIRADGMAVQHSAVFSPVSPTGTWTDDYGNGGTFAFAAPSPAPGSPRPLTLKGTYGGRDTSAGAAVSFTQMLAPISFGRALSFVPQARMMLIGALATAQCPGTAATPQAAPGVLCVYESSQVNRQAPILFDSNFNVAVADRFGAVVYIANTAAGLFGSSGTWAVTLP